MRLAIVLMLLFVAQDLYPQVPQPVPRKTAKGTARTSKQVQKQAAPDKQISAPNQTPIDQNATPKDKNGSNPERSNDTQKPIRIAELPPLSVTKDWADHAVWIFSGLLVIVGGLQAGLLAATLVAMRRQGLSMRRQTTHIRRSASAARKSANAASATVQIMKDTSEKQLRAYVYPVTASRYRHKGVMVIKLQIKNAGQTPAYDCTKYMVEAVSDTYPQPAREFERPVPNLDNKVPIPPGESINFFKTATQLSSQQEAQIMLGNAAIYLFGKIAYRDAFGNQRRSEFRLVCVGEQLKRGLFEPCPEGNNAD
jgi:hypothetical protein